jgi:hypothetical protein
MKGEPLMYNTIRISVTPSLFGTWDITAMIPGDPDKKVWRAIRGDKGSLAEDLADLGAQLDDDLRNFNGGLTFRTPPAYTDLPKPPPLKRKKKG